MRFRFLTLVLAATLLSPASSMDAGLSFVLTPAVEDGARSNAVVFTGTLSNTDPTNSLYLNDVQFAFSGGATNYLTSISNTFFANVPGILAPSETYSDVVCSVAIEAGTPAGDYVGSVTVVGGTNVFDSTTLASQMLQVSVFETPFDVWRFEQFGVNTNNPVVSGESADPDNDGIVNLLEYGLLLDPNVGSVAGLPAPQIDPACGCLTLTYPRVIGATDLRYTTEAADGPGGPWTTNGVTQVIVDADTAAQTIRASDTGAPIATATNRFIHLRIMRLP